MWCQGFLAFNTKFLCSNVPPPLPSRLRLLAGRAGHPPPRHLNRGMGMPASETSGRNWPGRYSLCHSVHYGNSAQPGAPRADAVGRPHVLTLTQAPSEPRWSVRSTCAARDAADWQDSVSPRQVAIGPWLPVAARCPMRTPGPRTSVGERPGWDCAVWVKKTAGPSGPAESVHTEWSLGKISRRGRRRSLPASPWPAQQERCR